ncbi:MAG TPA: BTAD domain-containing putative transcriptional regulator [Solirubrobacteraceae bacterium]|nr:BTAD domain-containing putative transcriptional regulator [Solirubrobacteraceae bacterium]
MEFRILGPLEVRADGRAVAVPGAKPRAVLAVLLLNANQAVTPDQLALALWGEDAPAGAINTVQVHISRLRKALGNTEALATTPGGYRLSLDPDDLDALRFDRLVAEARGMPAADAAAALAQALALWRGRALEDLAYEPFAQPEIARLEDARIHAHELRFEAKLALGAHAEVIGELELLIAEHPYREGLRAQLMLALYRADRQADALQVYQDARAKLVDELGIEPGERLRELERAILAQDAALAAPPAPAAAARETARVPPALAAASRRLVTVISAGFAARLDAESLHSRLDAYAAIVERHGGQIEGSVGDALVAVFGKAVVHEDHPLRAVRAAFELRAEGLSTLGIETGEAFVGPARATGEVFAVAAALERQAAAGEILLGDGVHELVHHAVHIQPAHGAYRLLALAGDGDRSHAGPFVNRHAELDGLRAAFARARDERACHAITVVGPPGMGKSRLTREFIAEVEAAATVAVGRCPTYGEGLAYRPLAEIVARLGGADPRERVNELLSDDPAAAPIVLGAIGLADGPLQAEETFWAVRRLFERVAETRPLVVVVEDVHWAEPALLDLLEYLTAFVSSHPVLLVCLARPDLGELRPGWITPRGDRGLLVLDPLPEVEARRLVEHAGEVVAATAARIVATAEGNPLFLQQLVAVGADDDDSPLPATIQAVLAARIARLEPDERALLGEASVQGRSFYVGALEDRATARLVSLVRQELIRPEPSELPGEDAFRFAHALIREAAYRALPKQRRADVHEHVARWIEERPGVQDATVGHHLAEAYRYRTELGGAGAHEQELAGEAAERLADAADAASLRGDPDAAARLLEHAASLLEWFPAARAETLPALAAALLEAGRIDEATRVADEAIAVAPDDRLRVRAQVERELIRLDTETGAGFEPARRLGESGLGALADDEYGQCRLLYLRGRTAWEAGQAGEAEAMWATASEAAERADARRELFELIGWRATAAAVGPTPVAVAIEQCEAWRERVAGSPLATASTLNPLALLYAMSGDDERAEQLLGEAREILAALGGLTAGVAHLEASVHLVMGRPERAETALRADLESAPEGARRAMTAALLARALVAQGRLDDAEELCRQAERSAASEDAETQVLWRAAAARIRAARGQCTDAETLAREALAHAETTDLLWLQGDAMLALAEVLRRCERSDEAERATRAGRALYDRKGIATSERPGGP